MNQLKLIVMPALLTGLALAAFAKNDVACSHAEITLDSNNMLATGKMGENALVNANRDYAFTKVPKCIQGMAYISHNHKASVGYSGSVKVGGRMYLCLTDGLKPSNVGASGDWKPAGKMTGGDAKGSMPWTVYQCDFTNNQKFKIKSAGKWGAVMVAGKIEAGKNKLPTLAKARKAASRSRSHARASGGSLDDEFGLIAGRLRVRKAGGEHYDRLAAEVFRKPALLFTEDRDPVDVVLRRTTALLEDIKKMKDAPDLSKQATQLAGFKTQTAQVPVDDADARKKLFAEICKVRRQIAFANPLINFDKILFATHHKTHGHMCDQYFGFHAK